MIEGTSRCRDFQGVTGKVTGTLTSTGSQHSALKSHTDPPRCSRLLPSSPLSRLEGNQSGLPRMDSDFARLPCWEEIKEFKALPHPSPSLSSLSTLPSLPIGQPNKLDTGPPPRVETIPRGQRMSPYNKDDSDTIYKVRSGSWLKGSMDLKNKTKLLN